MRRGILFNKKSYERAAKKQLSIQRSLLRREAEIGSHIFGVPPKDHRREFICIDETTWLWHEEWIDDNGALKSRTTRYDVRSDGIVKTQDGIQAHTYIDRSEAERLLQAAKIYEQKTNQSLYGLN